MGSQLGMLYTALQVILILSTVSEPLQQPRSWCSSLSPSQKVDFPGMIASPGFKGPLLPLCVQNKFILNFALLLW